MKETMQKHAAVFRVESLLQEGYGLLKGYWKEYSNIHCHDKSRVWYASILNDDFEWNVIWHE